MSREAVRKADLAALRVRVGDHSVAAALEAGRVATPDEVTKLTNAVTVGLATQDRSEERRPPRPS